jgi:CelD/BcsL family acetyltransferase involved in cellulose biosynthesis
VLPLKPSKLELIKGVAIPYLCVPTNPDIPLFDLVHNQGLPKTWLENMNIWLKQTLDLDWWFIRFWNVREDAKIFTLLQNDQSQNLIFEETKHSAYIDLELDFRKSFSPIKSKYLRNLRRQERKAKIFGKLNFETYGGKKLAKQVFSDFLTTEAKGWKGNRRTAIIYNDNLLSFYRSLISEEDLSYQPYIYLLKIDNKVIAAQLAVRTGCQLALLKIGFNEHYSSCGPGNILLNKVIESSLEQGIKYISFMNDPVWAKHWTSRKKQVFDITFFPKSFKSRLIRKMLVLKKWLRNP